MEELALLQNINFFHGLLGLRVLFEFINAFLDNVVQLPVKLILQLAILY